MYCTYGLRDNCGAVLYGLCIAVAPAEKKNSDTDGGGRGVGGDNGDSKSLELTVSKELFQ